MFAADDSKTTDRVNTAGADQELCVSATFTANCQQHLSSVSHVLRTSLTKTRQLEVDICPYLEGGLYAVAALPPEWCHQMRETPRFVTPGTIVSPATAARQPRGHPAGAGASRPPLFQRCQSHRADLAPPPHRSAREDSLELVPPLMSTVWRIVQTSRLNKNFIRSA